MGKLPKIIVVVGPTGSGKTALAERLAGIFDGEIVTADSRTVYRGLDIGTAKVTGKVLSQGECAGAILSNSGVYHWLVDLVNPDELFTVADWKKQALAVMAKIIKRKHLTIIAGGTGFYVRAIVDNLEPPRVEPDMALRAELETKPMKDLVAQLKKLDPEAAAQLDLKNPRRVIRALEIAIKTGNAASERRRRGKRLFDALQIGIKLPRKDLYARIDRRVEQMAAQGLFEEVKSLTRRYPPETPALSGIGYRQVIAYLENRLSLEEAMERIKFDTHAYARRQMTWFRKDKRIKWVAKPSEAEKLVKEFLAK